MDRGAPSSTCASPELQVERRTADSGDGRHLQRVQLDAVVGVTSNAGEPPAAINTTFGSAWLKPLNILQARHVKFGAQSSSKGGSESRAVSSADQGPWYPARRASKIVAACPCQQIRAPVLSTAGDGRRQRHRACGTRRRRSPGTLRPARHVGARQCHRRQTVAVERSRRRQGSRTARPGRGHLPGIPAATSLSHLTSIWSPRGRAPAVR
jgi:hypothetical protein